MTQVELLERVMSGRVILVGEFRNGRIESKSIVDRSSGEVIDIAQIVYAVECASPFGTVIIYRPVPADMSATGDIDFGLTKGRRYAFELDKFNRKRGFVTAQLGFREPEPID